MKAAARSWRNARSGGFSLDEAARICKELRTRVEGPAVCPHCGADVRPIVGAEGGEPVCLLRCDACGRSLVVREAPGATQAR